MIRRPAMLNERRGGRAVSVVLTVLLVLLLVLFFLDLLRAHYCLIVEVKGNSMLDTLYGGTRAGGDYEGGDIVYAVRSQDAERGDIVILDTTASAAYSPSGGAVFSADIIIKRVIAVGGDSVKCVGGTVYLNTDGTYRALDEAYAKGVTPDFPEVRLAEGEIFFLGDNRSNSADSEDIVNGGYDLLHTQDILGIVPGWALSIKGLTTAWEGFRAALGSIFS